MASKTRRASTRSSLHRQLHRECLNHTIKPKSEAERELLGHYEWFIEAGGAVEWVDSQWLAYALLLGRVLDRDE